MATLRKRSGSSSAPPENEARTGPGDINPRPIFPAASGLEPRPASASQMLGDRGPAFRATFWSPAEVRALELPGLPKGAAAFARAVIRAGWPLVWCAWDEAEPRIHVADLVKALPLPAREPFADVAARELAPLFAATYRRSERRPHQRDAARRRPGR